MARHGIWLLILALGAALSSGKLMAIEEPDYELIRSDGDIAVRDYGPIVVAEVLVESDFEDAGNAAFRPLFEYISDNDIAMTAPVTQQADDNAWAVRFVMPRELKQESLPEPGNSNLTMKTVPPRRVAVIRYSGTWSVTNSQEHLAKLTDWIEAEGYAIAGEASWARYTAPYSLWFMRRNEIHLPILTD